MVKPTLAVGMTDAERRFRQTNPQVSGLHFSFLGSVGEATSGTGDVDCPATQTSCPVAGP
jgi:hypothetical protein